MTDVWYPGWSPFSEWISDQFESLLIQTDIGAALADFAMVFIGYIFQLLMLIGYPFVVFVNISITVFNNTVTPIALFFANIIGIGEVFYNILAVFNGVFPEEWTFLLGAMITITIAFRIYQMIPLFGKGGNN